MIFNLNTATVIDRQKTISNRMYKKVINKTLFCCWLFLWLGMMTKLYPQKIISVQSYGNTAFHTSNFDSSSYNNPNGWIEMRFLLEKLKIGFDSTNTTCYLFSVGAMGKGRVAQEHKLVWGIGMENYLLPCLFPKVKDILPWFKFFRSFVDFSTIEYYRDEPSGDFPKKNLRAGMDIWYEKVPNLDSLDYSYCDLWYDVWLQYAYQSTNYKDKNYNTTNLGFVIHAGILKNRKNSPSYFLFYLLGEISASGKRYFWENRAVTGIGIRFFPIKNKDRFWNRLLCYAEGAWAIYYFKDAPEPLPKLDYSKSSFPVSIKGDTRPCFDFRFGISFSFGKWWNYSH